MSWRKSQKRDVDDDTLETDRRGWADRNSSASAASRMALVTIPRAAEKDFCATVHLNSILVGDIGLEGSLLNTTHDVLLSDLVEVY